MICIKLSNQASVTECGAAVIQKTILLLRNYIQTVLVNFTIFSERNKGYSLL